MKRILLFVFLTLFCKNALAAESWINSGLENNKIQTLKATPWGILAGEYDTRLWLNPFNGIYVSTDLGNTWNELGLANRGVNKLTYSNNAIYASTYYFHEDTAGLFVSRDGGKSWNHSCENFSTSSVSAFGNIVILGTYDHGLWISKNGGETCEQKLGDGFLGPTILTTFAAKDLLFFSTVNEVYISTDNGNTWNTIQDLSNLGVNHIKSVLNILLAGNNNGIYSSNDFGDTWNPLDSWETNPVHYLEVFDQKIYVGTNDGVGKLLVSKDFGNSWENTNFTPVYSYSIISSITGAFANHNLLYAATPSEGIYKYEIPNNTIDSNPFLSPPWNLSNSYELIEKIYSYFDHQYPLANYPVHSEPLESVVTFLGEQKSADKVYYSGHDGYDYALNRGESVLAAAAGNATYLWSDITGNTIVIDHQNGYKTIYGHLQDTGLVETPTWVLTGKEIGLVGVTGIVTGPHLHFAVQKNTALEKTDPYGWQNEKLFDPWAKYIWTDENGTHLGTSSKYLWDIFPEKAIKYFDHNGGEVILNNKKIIVDQNSSEYGFTVFVEPDENPKIPITQNRLTYMTGSSVSVNAHNLLGEKLPSFLKPVKIEMDFSNANLDDIWENTLSFYFWDEEEKLWEKVDSLFDVATRRVVGKTYHFSQFAVFAEKKPDWTKSTNITGSLFKIIE